MKLAQIVVRPRTARFAISMSSSDKSSLDNLSPGHETRDAGQLCGHAAMLLISGQEVAKQTVSTFQEIAFYEGAGSRIRTDDLLITNQPLWTS